VTLQSKVDALATGVGALKEEQSKSLETQCLHDEHIAKMEEQEKDLQQHLHDVIDALRSKSSVALRIFSK
jgi:hypothetical protein